MRRTEIVLLLVVAGLLVWIGTTRDTAAQVAQAQPGAGRFTISMVPVSAGGHAGYYAILLDTHTGRMWASSSKPNERLQEFEPLKGPMDPRGATPERPGAEPQR